MTAREREDVILDKPLCCVNSDHLEVLGDWTFPGSGVPGDKPLRQMRKWELLHVIHDLLSDREAVRYVAEQTSKPAPSTADQTDQLTKDQRKSLKRKKPRWGQRLFYMPYFTFIRDEAMWHRVVAKMDLANLAYPCDEGKARCSIFAGPNGATVCLVSMEPDWEKRDKSQIVSVLAHEAAHIYQEMRSDMGEKMPSAEFEAYTLQHILAELIFSVEHVTAWRLD